MALNSLIDYIANSQITKEIVENIKLNKGLNIIGSNRYAKSIIVNAISSIFKKDIVLICTNNELAYRWYGYFQSINNDNNILYYPANENLPYEKICKSTEVEYAQLNVINQIINNESNRNIIISTERSLQPHLLNKSYFIENNFKIQKGDNYEIKDLINKFILLGYSQEEVTSIEGKWSRRGDIVDIFPVNNDVPIRIEFYDNNVDKIREYDPSSQKTLDTIKEINITQSGSYQKIKNELDKLSKDKTFYIQESKSKRNLDRYLGIVEDLPNNLLNFIHKDCLIIIDEIDQCKKYTENWFNDSENNFNHNKEEIINMLVSNNIDKNIEKNLHQNIEEIYQQLRNFDVINFFEFESKNYNTNNFLLSDKIIKSPSKNISKLSSEINEFQKNNNKVWILSAQPLRTNTLLNEHECFSKYIENKNDKKAIQTSMKYSTPIIIKNKNNYAIEGFHLPIWKIVLITDKELYDQNNLTSDIYIRKRRKSVSKSINLNKINQGDYIVHKNHGIGRFLKIEKINIIGESRDYLVIQYLDGKISVAADQLGSINKYRGSGNIKPKINKLGGTEWFKIKE